MVGEVPQFMEIATRMPRLTELDLRMIIPARLIAKPLRAHLSSLPPLKMIIFPNCHTTSAVLSTLSHLPRLHTAQFEYSPSASSSSNLGAGYISHIQSLSPALTQASSKRSPTFPLRPPYQRSSTSVLGTSLTSLYIDCRASRAYVRSWRAWAGAYRLLRALLFGFAVDG